MLFVLFIPQVFSLKVLSFEKLNFAEESNISFALKFDIDQLPDQFVLCSSQHTAAPDDSYVYFLSNGEDKDLITLRYKPDIWYACDMSPYI